MANDQTAQTLNLSTSQFDRPKVRIDDGECYELRSRDEMSVAALKEQKRLQARIARFQDAVKAGRETSNEEFDEYIEAMVGFVELITVDMPREAIEALPAGMWKRLMEHYQTFGRAVVDAEPAAATG